MTSELMDKHVLENAEQLFRTGIPSFKVVNLSEQEARRYFLVISGDNRYDAEIKGPSVLNDIYKAIPLYSVEVSLNGGSNA